MRIVPLPVPATKVLVQPGCHATSHISLALVMLRLNSMPGQLQTLVPESSSHNMCDFSLGRPVPDGALAVRGAGDNSSSVNITPVERCHGRRPMQSSWILSTKQVSLKALPRGLTRRLTVGNLTARRSLTARSATGLPTY